MADILRSEFLNMARIHGSYRLLNRIHTYPSPLFLFEMGWAIAAMGVTYHRNPDYPPLPKTFREQGPCDPERFPVFRNSQGD